jgi:hypothetical protein
MQGNRAMNDTVTLALDGTVSLSEFSAALARFDALIVALATESQASSVVWQIDALDFSSAITTARAVPTNGTTPEHIDRVVRAYLEVGRCLERHETIPYSPVVVEQARSLSALLRGSKIEAIRFETADADAIIREPTTDAPPANVASSPRSASYGAVTGRIQTLTSRNSLRFILYDHIHDRAVSCYLVEGGETLMRQMWDRVATVEGWVSRDPVSGRPLTVRRVSSVTPITEVEPDAYKAARGAIPRSHDDPLPESLTRQLRDAG